MKYELVSGLETHIELSTKTKIFCGCTTEFGGAPNTHCCPICIGLPGTLPKLNAEVVNFAILAGLATNCTISNVSKMDRKNYVYPDLSKAYQISQFDKPLCENGYVTLDSGKKIGITRIHIEEDAGKLTHNMGTTLVDYNRGGVPLIEIVSEPDIRSAEEATEYLEKLQLIMKYIGVSDCKMQEGSMRCDVNVSLRPMGATEFGTRAEIKNMNSFTFIKKAMDCEYERQADLLDSGEEVVQETRRYNTDTGYTESMRGKEDAQDYRYFREPDLVTIFSSDEKIQAIKDTLPELPDAKFARYVADFELSEIDARLLTKYRKVCDYFDEAVVGLKKPKTVANLIISQIFKTLSTEAEKDAFDMPFPASYLNELVKLVEGGKVKINLAKTTLDKMLETGKPATDFISEKDMSGIDDATLEEACKASIEKSPNAVADFLGGKEKAIQVLMGGVMKATRGQADAVKTKEMILKLINA